MGMVVRHGFVRVFVVAAVLTVGMEMRVDMCMLMGMHEISVAVLMGMSVLVLVGVLQFDGVLDHKIRAGNHDCQSNIELDGRPFAQKQHAKRHP